MNLSQTHSVKHYPQLAASRFLSKAYHVCHHAQLLFGIMNEEVSSDPNEECTVGEHGQEGERKVA